MKELKRDCIMKSQKGYTLAEVMIVFSLFIMIINITFMSFKPLYRHFQINNFFQQLQLDISYAKIYAINHNKEVHLTFLPESHQYIIYTGGFSSNLIKRSFSENINLELGTLPSTLTFLQNGTLRKSGKMYIRYDEDYYVFVFLFGKGLTYVKKL